jgi:acetoin utilization protein AcuB
MNVSDIMTEKPVTVRLSDTLREALEAMDGVACHHLPVVSADGHVVGILSDRDCRTALNSPHTLRERWQDEDLADHLQVRAIMTPAPIIVEPDASADEAARLMLVNHISCLPVMRGETLIGIITTSDLLMAFMALHRRAADYDHGDKTPPHPINVRK